MSPDVIIPDQARSPIDLGLLVPKKVKDHASTLPREVTDAAPNLKTVGASGKSTARTDILRDAADPAKGGWIVYSRKGADAEVIELAEGDPRQVSV